MRWWGWVLLAFAQLVGGALMFAANIPLDEAASNISTYFQALGLNDLAKTLADSSLDKYAGLVGAILILGPIAYWLWTRKRSPKFEPSRRITLLELGREAERQGWRIREANSLESLDFFDAIRQAGIDGSVGIYGRRAHRFDEVTVTEPLVQIPQEHWRTHQFDLFGFLKYQGSGQQGTYASDNSQTRTTTFSSHSSGDFADIHLDRNDALKWLKTEGPTFRGRRDKRERDRAAAKQIKDQPGKRIRLREATVRAYEQTHGTLPEAAAEELSHGDIEGWYAAAITKDRDVTIYGRKPPSRVHVEVPQTDLQSFRFKEHANELVNQFDENRRYVDLEISEEDAERKIEEIRQWQ